MRNSTRKTILAMKKMANGDRGSKVCPVHLNGTPFRVDGGSDENNIDPKKL